LIVSTSEVNLPANKPKRYLKKRKKLDASHTLVFTVVKKLQSGKSMISVLQEKV